MASTENISTEIERLKVIGNEAKLLTEKEQELLSVAAKIENEEITKKEQELLAATKDGAAAMLAVLISLFSVIAPLIDMLSFYAPSLIGSGANFLGTVSLGGAAVPAGLVFLPLGVLIAAFSIYGILKDDAPEVLAIQISLFSIVLPLIDILAFYSPSLIGNGTNFLGTVLLGGAAGAIPAGLLLLPLGILMLVISIYFVKLMNDAQDDADAFTLDLNPTSLPSQLTAHKPESDRGALRISPELYGPLPSQGHPECTAMDFCTNAGYSVPDQVT